MIDTRVSNADSCSSPGRPRRTTPHLNKVQQVETALAQLIADASRRGFYGTAGLTLSIQDGHIQHIRVAMERMMK